MVRFRNSGSYCFRERWGILYWMLTPLFSSPGLILAFNSGNNSDILCFLFLVICSRSSFKSVIHAKRNALINKNRNYMKRLNQLFLPHGWVYARLVTGFSPCQRYQGFGFPALGMGLYEGWLLLGIYDATYSSQRSISTSTFYSSDYHSHMPLETYHVFPRSTKASGYWSFDLKEHKLNINS